MSIVTSLRWVALVSVLFWFIVYWQGGYKVMIDIQEAMRSKNSCLDTILLMVISLCSFAITGIGLLVSLGLSRVDLPQSWVIALTGTLLSISGIIGMFYCRYYLGRFWTAETTLSPNHQIVDKGPYKIVRHPIYTFAILMYIGLGLVFLSRWNLLIVGTIVVAYTLKARDEDNFLEQRLSGYREYKQRVRYHLVPGLW